MSYRGVWTEDDGIEYHSKAIDSLEDAMRFKESAQFWPWVRLVWIEKAAWTRMESE